MIPDEDLAPGFFNDLFSPSSFKFAKYGNYMCNASINIDITFQAASHGKPTLHTPIAQEMKLAHN